MASPKTVLHDVNDTAPSSQAAAVTPNDSTDLPIGPTRAVYVGTTGILKVDMVNGASGIEFAAAIGLLPLKVTRIYATTSGTTASNIVALY